MDGFSYERLSVEGRQVISGKKGANPAYFLSMDM
jgi:hypothetical protein